MVNALKIERINRNKLKITISHKDLNDWDIDIKTLTYNSAQAQDMFWAVVKLANDETGFFTDNSQLLVEAFIKSDSFIMDITKLTFVDDVRSVRTRKEPKKRKIYNPVIFAFTDLDTAITACKSIENRFIGKSKLYKYDGQYVILLIAENEYLARDLEVLLTEFGRHVDGSAMTLGVLTEHGTTLIEADAVANISSFL